MITYTSNVNNIKPEMLHGFFVGWPNPPLPYKHLEILNNSYKCWLAMDKDKVVGFINAVSDGTLAAYIPLLEVLPEYQRKGIGRRLMELMMESLKNFYMIDLVCDDEMKQFYNKFNMRPVTAMGIRNYSNQNGNKL